MTITPCPECYREVAANSSACPSCGYPMPAEPRQTRVATAVSRTTHRYPWFDVTLLFLGSAMALVGSAAIWSALAEFLYAAASISTLIAALVAVLCFADKYVFRPGQLPRKSPTFRFIAGSLFVLGIAASTAAILPGKSISPTAPQKLHETPVEAASDVGRLRFSVPAGWWRRPDREGVDLAVEGPDGAVAVTVERIEGEMPHLDQAVLRMASESYGHWQNFEAGSARTQLIAGQPRSIVELTGHNPHTNDLWRIQLQLVRDRDVLALLRLAAPDQLWDAGRPQLEQVAATFTVEQYEQFTEDGSQQP
jgi:hypothetical protein